MGKMFIFSTLILALLLGVNYYEQNVDINEDVEIGQHEFIAEEWLSYSGIITNVNRSGDHQSVLVSNQTHDIDSFIFFLGEQVFLLDDGTKELISFEDLVEGDRITAYYGSHTPMLLSMPPQIGPAVFIVNTGEDLGTIKVSHFDSDLISTDGSLKLNVGTSTDMLDQFGNELSQDDLYNQDLVVFYTTSTRSIPAQAVPDKIILLSE